MDRCHYLARERLCSSTKQWSHGLCVRGDRPASLCTLGRGSPCPCLQGCAACRAADLKPAPSLHAVDTVVPV